MEFTPGKRFKIARELMEFSRTKFSKLTGIDYVRLITIEEERGRLGVDDVAAVLAHFPELLHWLVLGTPIDINAFSQSENERIRMLADNLETHGYPEVDGA